MKQVRFHFNSARRAAGFTLVEVMISLALVLLLTYGIAQVFKMTGDTVGAQTSIMGWVRDHRAAVTTLSDDFRNCVNDSPLFLIDSQVAYDGTQEFADGKPAQIGRGFRAGFRTPLEESQAPAPNPPLPGLPLYVKDPTNYEVNGQLLKADFNTYSDRTPRLDRLAFFARGLYRRQTASISQVYSPTTTTEAYIWIGHTALPGRQTATVDGPASGSGYANNKYFMTLPQNQYGQDRILGRMAIMLGDPNTFQGGTTPDLWLGGQPSNPTPLAPLDYDSGAFQSYTDLAGITLDQWRARANAWYQVQGPFQWYSPMDDDFSSPQPTAHKIWRAMCQPTLQRPINSQKMAQTSTCFIPHCTQFIVEYAGDYLAQNSADVKDPGKVTDAAQKMDPSTGAVFAGNTDGEIDYYIDTTADPQLKDRSLWVKRIRWYGLPRDTNGDGAIDMRDVLPLADVMDFYGIQANGKSAIAPWEAVLPFPGFTSAAIKKDYANFKAPLSAKNFKYVCAWHNAAPAMIRISMKFDDPSGKLQDGQWYEYVLTR